MEERSKQRKRKKVNNKSIKKAADATILNLPFSILGDIFSRLPIKAILCCGSVSESWRSLLVDPDFANQIPLLKSLPESYILRSNKHVHRIHPRKICLFDPEESLSSVSYRDRNGATINFKSDFGLPTTVDFELVNSCNGFLCLCDSRSRYPTYILNPIMGEYIKLPLDVPKSKEIENCSIFSRLGFSPGTNQYKVVRCFSNHSSNRSRVEILTLGTGTWRRIDYRTPNKLFSERSHFDAFLNGAIHWITPDFNLIYCFNFGDETIRYISPPPAYLTRRTAYKFNASLGVVGGCLTISFQGRYDLEIWRMKVYADINSWTKMFVIRWYRCGFRSLRLLKNGNFLLYDGRVLTTYIPNNQGDDRYRSQKFEKLKTRGIQNFQLVAHTPSFTSFRDFTLGENLKVFRVNMIREDELKSRRLISWCPPAVNELKFNVDESAWGKQGAAGIGGVLRDDKGDAMCLFSSPIGSKASNEAELLAIWKALELFKNSEWNGVKELVIESHSKAALDLVNKTSRHPPPSNLLPVLEEINDFISAIQRVRFVHAFREGNDFAYRLAKLGEEKAVEFCEWF